MKGLQYVVFGGALLTILIVIMFEKDGGIDDKSTYLPPIKKICVFS